MAFDILGATNSREVRGSKLVRVRTFQVLSLPSETYFEFRRSASQPCFAAPGPCAAQFSDRIEAVLGLPVVTDVDYFQDTSAGGRLEDWMRTFWETPDGKLSGWVEQKLAEFGPNATAAAIAQDIADGPSL